MDLMTVNDEVTHFHGFCGLGGGALGFNRAEAKVGKVAARMRCLGGVDADPAAIRDFSQLAGVKGTVLDMFSVEQFRVFHAPCRPTGKRKKPKRCKACNNTGEPPVGWKEVVPGDILRAAGGECPDLVFTSPPCKGFSGLLNTAAAASPKYQALNGLVTRFVHLALTAFEERPPSFFLLENVPRIMTRGTQLLDEVKDALEVHGYVVNATSVHDCGELGGLAQHRRRFLLVARHRKRVPPHLFEPPKRGVLTVGDVLDELPLPDDPKGGPMHTTPRLTRKTWLRLALIPAGSDWRALRDIDPTEFGIEPATSWRNGVLGVRRMDEPAGTVCGEALPTNGAFAIADGRSLAPPDGQGGYHNYGVARPEDTSETVTGKAAPGAGRFSWADGRGLVPGEGRYNNVFRIVRFDEPGVAVTGGMTPSSGAASVGDPRPPDSAHMSKYRVTRFDEAAGSVIGASATGQGAFAMAERRPFASSGQFGVLPWDGQSNAVTGHAKHDNGKHSVADPRPSPGRTRDVLFPVNNEQGVWVIQALDDTWHRPFTTWELAALQGFPVMPEDRDPLELFGGKHTHWRMRIGNAVPPPAAQAIASVMAKAVLQARAGISFQLNAAPIWVAPYVDLITAMSVDVPPTDSPEGDPSWTQ